MFTHDTKQQVANKIMILYTIQAFSGKVTKTHLTDFFMTYDYMNFFEFQQYCTELLETSLIDEIYLEEQYVYKLSDNGLNSLKFFSDRIEKSLRKEIDLRVEIENAKNEVSVKPEGHHSVDEFGNHYAELIIKTNDQISFHLKLMVDSRQKAEILISKWYDDFLQMSETIRTWF